MPLWSNEDWRARIGSCWCALGRTFNTRFTRCRGKSQRDLSTHQAATMVIMMILFIAANMGLYVTRERHKNLICVFLFGETITELHLFRFGLLVTLFVPVLKFVVQMVCGWLPRKLNISLKQFFIDLNNSLWFIGSVIWTFIVSPVLFVVNFTTGNIGNVLGKLSHHMTKLIGDRLSNGILMKSLVVVIIVIIQLLVSVVVARAIVLLISGDVERNPGPGHIDYSVTKELLVELETTAVQASLLLRCGDVESNPGPLNGEGGVNQDVERNMNEVVKSGQITDSDRMFKDLALVIHDKFMEVGLELGLEYETLCNELEVMKRGSDKAMKMLQLWKQSITGDNFTYSVLATALEKHGHKQAAHKFCYTEATSNLQSKPQQCVETCEAPTANSGNNPPPTVASVAPTVNVPHGYHNYQSPQPSSSFMLPPPIHMLMHNQPSFSQHLNIQGVSPTVNIPHGYHNYQRPRPSSSFMLHPPVHIPMHDQPSLSPHLHNQGFELTPQAKRFKHDPSQQLLGQVPLCTHDLHHIDRWHKMLVDFYLSQEDSESTDAWPPLKMVDFVTLALVKQDKQDYHLGLQTPQKDVDAVYGKKTNIRYEDIFQTVDKRCLVLFEGRPGSGKTTLMVRVSCDWGRGTFLKSKLVLLVRLRHLSKTGDIYLHDLLRVACPAFTPDDVQGLSSYIERRLGEDVVFLLDGFDEYGPGTSDDNYITKLVLKKMYSQSIVILSSRPAATQRFRQRARVWIEVVGFMREQVYQYINCYFEEKKEKSSSLIKHLEDHQNLMNLCYLPLHCAMLVHLYNVDATLPETETEFYRDFTLSLLFRGIRKHMKMPLNIESFDCLPTSEQLVFHKVCKLAFKATLDSRQVFKERELKDICFKNSSEDSLGLVVVDRYFAKSGTDETYTFLHLTLQEYLAAVFVSNLSESEQIDAIATHFFKQHFFVTSRFLFGILDYSKEITKNLFKQMLYTTKNAHLHHIQCACESQSVSACTDVVNFHDKCLSFEEVNNSSDIFYISYVLKTVKYVAIELSFSECNFDINNAVSILQGVGDRQLSLTIKQGKASQSMLNALSHVTVSGLVELVVSYKLDTTNGDKYLTMETNYLRHSTKLQKLDLEGISNSGLEKALEFWPNLVKLKLDHCHCHVTSIAKVLEEGLQHMTKAHHTTDQTLRITLKDCDFNKEAAVGLLQAVGDRRLLLDITHKDKDIDKAQPLVDALCLVTLPGLIELNVCYFDDGYDVHLTMRPNNLKHSTNLQILNLWGVDVSNSGLEKALKHWPNLMGLELDCCHCHVTSVADVLGEGLQHMTKAHHTNDQTLKITLEDCDFNKEAAVGLLQAVGDRRLLLTIKYQYMDIDDKQPLVDALCLVTLPGLIELNVNNYVRGDDDPTVRLNNLKHSTNLQKLELYGFEVSNSGLEKALKHWPNLVKLNLNGNPIGDDGLHALSLPIKNYCKELKKLLFWVTHLTDRSITCLTEWIKVLNNLEYLNIGSNHFSEGGVKQIEEAVSERNTREYVAKLELDISDQEPLSP